MHVSRSARASLALGLLVLGTSSAAAQSLSAPTQAELDGLDLVQAELQTLALPGSPQDLGGTHSIAIELDGVSRTVHLWPHSVRALGFELLVQGEDGLLIPTEPAPPATLRGVVEGSPLSRVAGTLVGGQLEAIVSLAPDQELWGIHPLSDVRPGAAASSHLVYRAGDVLASGGTCGTDDLWQLPQETGPAPSQGAADGGSNLRVCEIACDADFQFYTQNSSSVTATENDVEKIVNGVSLIYEADAEIIYDVTTIIVRTAEPDPYSTTNSSGRLSQFKNHWVSNLGSVTRDIAHLFTGVNLDGSTIGVAYLNVICSKNQGYGLSQSKYTSSLTGRVGLTAHELGHNWSSSHCDGQSDCKIMCSGLGGCGPVTSFGNYATGKILNKKNSSNCLSAPGPATLSSAAPSSVQAFSLNKVTLSGTSLQGVDTLLVGAVALDQSGFNVTGATTLTFTPPIPTLLGSVPVVAVKAGQSSNPVFLTYAETDPAVLSTPTTGSPGQLHSWTWGGGANDFAIVVLAVDGTTFPLLPGVDVLLNAVPLIPIAMGPTGVYTMTIPFPALPLATLLYNQVVLFDGVELDATNVAISVVGF